MVSKWSHSHLFFSAQVWMKRNHDVDHIKCTNPKWKGRFWWMLIQAHLGPLVQLFCGGKDCRTRDRFCPRLEAYRVWHGWLIMGEYLQFIWIVLFQATVGASGGLFLAMPPQLSWWGYISPVWHKRGQNAVRGLTGILFSVNRKYCNLTPSAVGF